MTAVLPPEVASALIGLAGLVLGAFVKSVYDWRSSASQQASELLIERDKEISLLRQALDRRHTHLSAYARTLEIVLLALKLPLAEQVETIRQAREHLQEVLAGSAGAGGGGR
jgi:hypothetical protein